MSNSHTVYPFTKTIYAKKKSLYVLSIILKHIHYAGKILSPSLKLVISFVRRKVNHKYQTTESEFVTLMQCRQTPRSKTN